jgi:hypothetical protein
MKNGAAAKADLRRNCFAQRMPPTLGVDQAVNASAPGRTLEVIGLGNSTQQKGALDVFEYPDPRSKSSEGLRRR